MASSAHLNVLLGAGCPTLERRWQVIVKTAFISTMWQGCWWPPVATSVNHGADSPWVDLGAAKALLLPDTTSRTMLGLTTGLASIA